MATQTRQSWAWLNDVACQDAWEAKHNISEIRILTLNVNVLYHTTPNCGPKLQDPCSINYFDWRYFEGSESYSLYYVC